MWRGKTVAVIFPTYREKRSILRAIKEFDLSGYIDEILVVDNNAEKGTEEEVGKTRAVLIKEKRQGFGQAIRTGIAHSDCDLLIVAEPDGTFKGGDIAKLLSYSDDFDVVFGSRTHLSLIEKDSQMTFLRRYTDLILAKMISFLFLCPPLSDVGCILRLTSRRGWKKVVSECQADDAIFATQWQLIVVKNKVRFVEIPINFRSRIGRSSITATFGDQVYWGIKIFLYIWKVWFYTRMGKKLN